MKKKYLFLLLSLLFLFINEENYSYADYKNNFICKLDKTNILSTESDITKKTSFSSLSKNIKNDVIYVIADSQSNSLISTSIFSTFMQSTYLTDSIDYLKNVPGFSMIRNSGTNNDLIFRGMFGSRIRILMDNSEIIGACCDHMDPASAYINMENFDILNIIKGTQTVLHGTTTLGGILQFQRYHSSYFHEPTIKLRSNVVSGSNSSYRRHIDSIVGNKYGYIRLIGNLAYSDDYYDGHNCRVHSAWYKWDADTILSLSLTELDTRVEINLGQGNSSANYATKSMDGLCFARENYGLKIESIDISSLLSKIEFQIWHHHIYHIMMNHTSNTRKFFVNTKHCCTNRNINDFDRMLWNMRSVATFDWENIQCFSGIDMQINHHKKNKIYNNNSFINIFTKEVGIFSECVFDLLSNQKFIGGVRIEHITSSMYNKYHNMLNAYQIIYPTGFIRYENNIYPSLSYYIGIGTSQCFPDYWELISSIYNNCSEKIEQIFQLDPEKTIQIDFGAYFHNKKIDSCVSSYLGYIKNYNAYYHSNIYYNQHYLDDYIDNMYAKIFGSEIEFSYKFNDYWYGKSNISYTWGITGNRCMLPTVSPLSGMLMFQFRQKNYFLTSSWRLVSPSKYIKKIHPFFTIYRNFDPTNVNINIPGYGVFSIYATIETSKCTTYSLGIDNLFNQNYIEYANAFNLYARENIKTFQVYEPGRTWWIKAQIVL